MFVTNEPHLSRLAHDDDCRLLWDWANDEAVRSAAFSSASIPWADHVQWFQAGVASKRRSIYIVETEDARPVGQVRFDTTSLVECRSRSQRREGVEGADSVRRRCRLASETFRRGSNALHRGPCPSRQPSVASDVRKGRVSNDWPERVGEHDAIRLELAAETSQPHDACRE